MFFPSFRPHHILMADDDAPTLLCMRVDEALSQLVVKGSIQRPCKKCGDQAWVAPSGQKLVAEGAEIICMDCAAVIDDPLDPKGVIQSVTPEQKEEIARDASPEYADWVEKVVEAMRVLQDKNKKE